VFLEKIFFAGHLEKNEKIIFVIHKHWIEILQPLVQTIFFGIALPGIFTFFFPIIFWGAVFWGIIFLLYFFWNFCDWYFDVWIATNKSVIDFEWKGIFHQLSSRIPYSVIDEFAWEVNGFWRKILGFGNAKIKTANGEINLINITNPKKAELKIISTRDTFVNQKKIHEKDKIMDLLSEIIQDKIEKEDLLRSRRF